MKINLPLWKPGRRGYVPSQTFGSETPDCAAAGENVMFEGVDEVRAVKNPLDIAKNVVNSTLGYNLALVANQETATASGGSLLTDMVPFQHFLVNNVLFTAAQLNSNTELVPDPKPTSTVTAAIVLVPNLHAINNKRASLLAGNVVSFLQALWVVGRGVLKVEGASISSSLTATSTPQVAYPVTNTTYDVRNVGFTRPSAPSVTTAVGGTKAMPAKLRSFRVSKKRADEFGYGPASEPVLVDMTSAASLMMRITFAAYDTSQGQNRWLVWVTKDEVSTAQGGPWFEYAEFDYNNTTQNIEYRSGELGAQYVEDYTLQPDPAVCVAQSGNVLLWGGCLAIDASGNATIPGGVVESSSPLNPEGYPSTAYAPTTNGEAVVSIKIGKVQMYVLGPNMIQYATLTQGTQKPLVILPWLQTGVRHQYNACLGADIFVVFTDGKLLGFYDENLATEPMIYEMADRVASLLKTLPASRVFLGYDPASNSFVLFCSNYRQGSGSGWQTLALVLDLRAGRVSTPIFLGNGTDHFTVSGVTTVQNHLEFVTTDGKCWRWERGTGSVTGFLGSPFSAWGSNLERCTVRHVGVVGNLDGQIAILSDLNETALTATAAPSSATYPVKDLDNATNALTRFPVWTPNVPGDNHAVRLDFTMEGGTNVFDLVEVGAVKREGAEN